MSTATQTQLPAATWGVDPVHSTAGFSIKYMVSTFRAGFAKVDATLDTTGDTPVLKGSVDPTTIDVKDENFHAHLQSPDFFDSERHPAITFRGGDVMRLPNYVAVPGSLTIRGVTRTEELRCSIDDITNTGQLAADVTLSRRAYGVGVPTGIRRLDPLFVVIGDEVRISIRVTR